MVSPLPPKPPPAPPARDIRDDAPTLTPALEDLRKDLEEDLEEVAAFLFRLLFGVPEEEEKEPDPSTGARGIPRVAT